MAGPKGQQLALKISGLYTDPNSFSEVPQGLTLASATNVVLDKDSILNSRRGFPQYGAAPDGSTPISGFFDYKDVLIIAERDGALAYDAAGDGSVWTQYPGTYLPPSGSTNDRLVSFQAGKNLYFGTRDGVFKLESVTASPRQAGVSAGLGGSGVTVQVVPPVTAPGNWSASSGLLDQADVYGAAGATLAGATGVVSASLASLYDGSMYDLLLPGNVAAIFVFPTPVLLSSLVVTVGRDDPLTVLVYWDAAGNRVDGGLSDEGSGYVPVSPGVDQVTWDLPVTVSAFSLIGSGGYPQGAPITIREITVNT